MKSPEPGPSHRVASDVRFRPVFDEGIVIRQRAAEVLVLNEVGTRILELLAKERTLGEIRDTLTAEFDTAGTSVDQDVDDFVAQLEAAGVIERAGGSSLPETGSA